MGRSQHSHQAGLSRWEGVMTNSRGYAHGTTQAQAPPTRRAIKPTPKPVAKPVAKRNARLAASKWLTSAFPGIFDPDKPKPLEIGVRTKLLKLRPDTATAGGLKNALTAWCRKREYQIALAEHGAMCHRLDGEPVEEVSAEHRLLAEQKPRPGQKCTPLPPLPETLAFAGRRET